MELRHEELTVEDRRMIALSEIITDAEGRVETEEELIAECRNAGYRDDEIMKALVIILRLKSADYDAELAEEAAAAEEADYMLNSDMIH